MPSPIFTQEMIDEFNWKRGYGPTPENVKPSQPVKTLVKVSKASNKIKIIPKKREISQNKIREDARRTYAKVDGREYCTRCGYSTCYEVCHIKPVSTFDDNDGLEVINHPSNLIGLCPTCHWEMDHPDKVPKRQYEPGISFCL